MDAAGGLRTYVCLDFGSHVGKSGLVGDGHALEYKSGGRAHDLTATRVDVGDRDGFAGGDEVDVGEAALGEEAHDCNEVGADDDLGARREGAAVGCAADAMGADCGRRRHDVVFVVVARQARQTNGRTATLRGTKVAPAGRHASRDVPPAAQDTQDYVVAIPVPTGRV